MPSGIEFYCGYVRMALLKSVLLNRINLRSITFVN